MGTIHPQRQYATGHPHDSLTGQHGKIVDKCSETTNDNLSIDDEINTETPA